MKATTHKLTLFLLFVVSNISLYAQPYKDPKFGADSASRMQCVQNLSTLSEFMKIDLYSYALDAFHSVFTNCPKSGKNLYIHGARIYKYLIENEKDETSKKNKIDTLMLIYDKRMEYYNEVGLVSGRKGLDLLKYTDQTMQGYQLLKRSVQLQKDKSEEAVITTLMQTAGWLLKSKQIDQAEYLGDYNDLMSLLDIRAKAGIEPDKTANLIEAVNSIFASGESIDCNGLVSVFKPKFVENKQNVEWLTKILLLMDGSKCQDDEFYGACLEQLFLVEPTANLATQLANLFYRRKDDLRSIQYFSKAIEMEQDPEKKSRSNYYMAVILSKDQSQYKDARNYAMEAIKLNPGWGDPYILIGNLYASSSKICASNEFEQKAIYWVAVDQFLKAKSADSTVTEEANRLINQYIPYFPNKENAFFYGFTAGNSYTVGCWINESTKVRF
jgi:tetratricopeptide (TPR) repeat protein